MDKPTLHDHMPVFLNEIAAAFDAADEDAVEQVLQHSPPAHGLQRLRNGFEIEEVVAEYHILRDCLHDLADKHGISLQGRPFHILHRALDAAIAGAVKSYALQQAQQVQQRREDYLAFIAHDLRTPLAAIALAGQLLEKTLASKDDPARAARALTTLQRNVGYLTALVGKVLEENANLETESGIKLERRKLDLWPLVEALIHDLHPIAGSGSTRLVNRIPEDLAAYADAALLRRIFQNLIANGIRFAPYGEVVISAEQANGNVICKVSDNGAGIAADCLPYIFEKFETDSKSSAGLGLGLTICKTFIDAHGGVISVNSEPRKGACFCFTLPDEVRGTA